MTTPIDPRARRLMKFMTDAKTLESLQKAAQKARKAGMPADRVASLVAGHERRISDGKR